MFTFGMGYGKLLGVLESRMYSFELVPPGKWKKTIYSGGAGKESKDKIIAFIMNKYPMANLYSSERSKKVHDGMAEALAIAHYGLYTSLKGHHE
jgi:hypothetical protein